MSSPMNFPNYFPNCSPYLRWPEFRTALAVAGDLDLINMRHVRIDFTGHAETELIGLSFDKPGFDDNLVLIGGRLSPCRRIVCSQSCCRGGLSLCRGEIVQGS